MLYVLSITFVLGLVGISRAADCLTDQPRQESTPTGDQIAQALTSQAQLDGVCAGNWRTGDEEKLENSYNHWGLIYSIKRQDNTKPLAHCKGAFENIISQCISGDNYWGGTWSLDGETYTISNSMYPGNPLAPTDDGGPPEEDTGPITDAPAPTSGPEAFTTTTQSIEGLTTNSQTTTSVQDHQTILPIWFVSVGIGIILIPGAGVPVGAPIPPPPGLPPLHIDPDGEVAEGEDTDDDEDDDDDESSTATTTSSCSQCSDCPDLNTEHDDVPGDDSDYDLAAIDPNIWSSMDEQPASPGPTEAPPPTVPIDQPGCNDAPDKVKDDLSNWTTKGRSIRLSDGSFPAVNDILYMLRQTLCDGSCKAPDKIDPKYVAVYQEGGRCEISIGISAEIEAFVNRDTWPEANDQFDTIWQQCWDSTQNIIDKCIDDQAKEGWWNGNHAYQYYSAGLRALNDGNAHHTQHGININNFLMPSTEGLSCDQDCCGYIPNLDWCVSECGGTCDRRIPRPDRTILRRRSRADFARADDTSSPVISHLLKRESVRDVGGCNCPYTLPGYPSAGRAIAAGVPSIWFDVDTSQNCDNPQLLRATAAVPGSNYNTEHVYEKHIIRRYLYYLIGPEHSDQDPPVPIASCSYFRRVFDTLSPQGVFATQTAAQQLANAVSCRGGGCPDDNRVSEFFLLKSKVNSMKNLILTGTWVGRGRDGNDNKLPKCEGVSYKVMQSQMINVAMVYQYLNRNEVYQQFLVVHRRIQGILDQLDADPQLGGSLPPLNFDMGTTWRATYDEFMVRFLTDSDRKMEKWVTDCRRNYDAAVDSLGVSDAQKDTLKRKVSDYVGNGGVYSNAAVGLDVGVWGAVRGNDEV